MKHETVVGATVQFKTGFVFDVLYAAHISKKKGKEFFKAQDKSVEVKKELLAQMTALKQEVEGKVMQGAKEIAICRTSLNHMRRRQRRLFRLK